MINRVVTEQKQCQIYLYLRFGSRGVAPTNLSLVLIESSEPNGIAIRRRPRPDQMFCPDITGLPVAYENIGYPRSFDV